MLYAARPDWRAERLQYLLFFCAGVFWSVISLAFFCENLAALLGYAPEKGGASLQKPIAMWFSFFLSIPFVAIGFVLLAAPFFSARKSKNTAHVITDVRLMNVYGGKDADAEIYKLVSLNFLKRRDLKNGFGNLSIAYGVEKDVDGHPRPLTTDWAGIPDVGRAELIIRGLAKWIR